jgi:superfamily II DNA or RNA helicase
MEEDLKASVSNRIYLKAPFGSELETTLRDALTHILPPDNPSDFEPKKVCGLQRVNESIVSIPGGRTDLIPEGYEIIDRRCNTPAKFPKFKLQLREDQEVLYNSINDSGIVIANASFGKTFTALALAAKFGLKTLVITHTTVLRTQWVEETEKCFGFTPKEIGGGKLNTEGPLVVGNIQTIRKYASDIADTFGLVIVDECHAGVSDSFIKVYNTLRPRYALALTATYNRKDGKHVLLEDHFGINKYTTGKANQMVPVIHSYESPVTLSDNMMIPWADKVTAVYADSRYRIQCLNIARAYLEQGRTILFVSDRTELLQWLAHETNQAFVTGEVAESDRKIILDALQSGEIQAVFGNFGIFAAGFSRTAIDCLVIGMAINNDTLLEQLVGRAIRIAEGKKQPIIADVALKGTTARKQRNARFRFYTDQGYEIVNIREQY